MSDTNKELRENKQSKTEDKEQDLTVKLNQIEEKISYLLYQVYSE